MLSEKLNVYVQEQIDYSQVKEEAPSQRTRAEVTAPPNIHKK